MTRSTCAKLLVATMCLSIVSSSRAVGPEGRPIATFSIVACDSVAEEWGVAVQSKFLGVGVGVPWAKAGVGAIATQAWANTTYGPEGLTLLEMGVPAPTVVEILTSKDSDRDQRQLGVVDLEGKAASWTGEKCMEWAGHIVGEGFCVQGNILVGEEVVQAMVQAFESAEGPLGRRLISALHAGQEAGGDSRGKQSAALLVVREAGGYSGYDDRFIDLRVDDHPDPIQELERIYDLHEQTFQGWAYVHMTEVALRKGREKQAQNALESGLSLARKYPENAHLLNSIAWELAINEIRLDDALELAQKAVELEPDDGNIWDTLGEVFARRGNYAEAVRAEEKAVELSSGYVEFQEKLERWRGKLAE